MLGYEGFGLCWAVVGYEGFGLCHVVVGYEGFGVCWVVTVAVEGLVSTNGGDIGINSDIS